MLTQAKLINPGGERSALATNAKMKPSAPKNNATTMNTL